MQGFHLIHECILIYLNLSSSKSTNVDLNINKELVNRNVSSVQNMDDMFYLNTSFNQNISSWNVSNVSSCTRFGALDNPSNPGFINCNPD